MCSKRCLVGCIVDACCFCVFAVLVAPNLLNCTWQVRAAMAEALDYSGFGTADASPKCSRQHAAQVAAVVPILSEGVH